MKIAIVTPYGEAYSNDKLFDPAMCSIGQNLLLPGIKLKERLEELGHEYHTVDMYDNKEEIDVWLFQDLNNASRLTMNRLTDWLKYIFKKKWEQDYFYKYSKLNRKCKAILIIQEPTTVFRASYDKKNHKWFNKIMTWDERMVDNKRYFQFFYPQVMPKKLWDTPYDNKKFITMICGNKHSTDRNELYSERLNIIQYFEQNNIEFDLYGFGWNKSDRTSYRGKVEDKLYTMAKYKFSICFENMKSKSGYITEKIFDAFFSGCVPVYYGAEDISRFIPENTFIDYRKFDSLDELYLYLHSMDEIRYKEIISNINRYLQSDLYKSNFSIDSYVNRMADIIIGD